MEKNNSRTDFGSRFGVLVAMAGSAVGLGNMWRFPYLVGENGGAAFIIIYIVCVILVGIPILCSEFIIGRRAKSDAIGSYKKLAPGSRWWLVGLMSVIASGFVISFYSVVGGWSVKYLVEACTFSFTTGNFGNPADAFSSFVTSPWQPLMYDLIFLAATAVIIILGVKQGIEKFSKIMMPLLFVIVLLIVVRSVTLPGSSDGLKYLFSPDFSKITSRTILAALGQAFFSLSLGCGTILTYASYVKKDENVFKCSYMTAGADTLFALIAACAIMPAVFAFGITPGQGPGLVFVTLPHIFEKLPLGGIIAILFFLALFIAAITSSISLLEVVIAAMIEQMKMSRKKAVVIATTVIFSLSILCSLSQGVLGNFKLFGFNLFDLFDYISANILMTLGALFVVLFVGWKLGKSSIKDELSNGGNIRIPKWLFNTLYAIIRYLAPIVIIIIFLAGILS